MDSLRDSKSENQLWVSSLEIQKEKLKLAK